MYARRESPGAQTTEWSSHIELAADGETHQWRQQTKASTTTTTTTGTGTGTDVGNIFAWVTLHRCGLRLCACGHVAGLFFSMSRLRATGAIGYGVVPLFLCGMRNIVIDALQTLGCCNMYEAMVEVF